MFYLPKLQNFHLLRSNETDFLLTILSDICPFAKLNSLSKIFCIFKSVYIYMSRLLCHFLLVVKLFYIFFVFCDLLCITNNLPLTSLLKSSDILCIHHIHIKTNSFAVIYNVFTCSI